tara:strand:+ start:204 stop:557 length:354 start_codon:yes stop_codon:yes gene_type:complete
MSKTKYTKENHLKHFEEQLAFRDSFIEKEAKYLENKRDELGISTYEKIAELCFALHMQDEIDDDGFMYYGEDLRIYHKITNIGDSLLYGFNLEYNGTAYLFTTIDTSIMVDGILIIG